MSDRIITYEELKRFSGYDKPVEIAVWMDQNGIARLTDRRNRPCTTIDAIDIALGIRPASYNNSILEVDRNEEPWTHERMTFAKWIESNWQSILKHPKQIVEDAVPMGKYTHAEHGGCGLYFLLLDNKITYVGVSQHSISNRVCNHLASKKFSKIYVIPLEWKKTYLLQIESFYIGWLYPKDNRTASAVPHLLKAAQTSLTDAHGDPEPCMHRGSQYAQFD